MSTDNKVIPLFPDPLDPEEYSREDAFLHHAALMAQMADELNISLTCFYSFEGEDEMYGVVTLKSEEQFDRFAAQFRDMFDDKPD